MLYFMIVRFGFFKMVSADFQQIGHSSHSCHGFKLHSVQSRQTDKCYLWLYMGGTLRPVWTQLTVAHRDSRLCLAGKKQSFGSELR